MIENLLLEFDEPVVELDVVIDRLVDGDGEPVAGFFGLNKQNLVAGIGDGGEIDESGIFNLRILKLQFSLTDGESRSADAGIAGGSGGGRVEIVDAR